MLTLSTAGCGASESPNEDPHKARIKLGEASNKARHKLIKEHCKVGDDVLFSLRDYIIKLPCAYVANVKHFSNYNDKIDYNDPLLAKELRPIPVSSFQFSIEGPDKHEVFGDVRPPLGVVLNIAYNQRHTDKIKSKCSKSLRSSPSETLWCQHNMPIQGTKLGAGLRFNATQYPLSKIPITLDKFPYAYYPEGEWPQLYLTTEAFVKSLLQKTKNN